MNADALEERRRVVLGRLLCEMESLPAPMYGEMVDALRALLATPNTLPPVAVGDVLADDISVWRIDDADEAEFWHAPVQCMAVRERDEARAELARAEADPSRIAGAIVSVHGSASRHGGAYGEILADDGEYYLYSSAECYRDGTEPVVGLRVSFARDTVIGSKVARNISRHTSK